MTDEQAIRNRVQNARCQGHPMVRCCVYEADICELLRIIDTLRNEAAMAEVASVQDASEGI